MAEKPLCKLLYVAQIDENGTLPSTPNNMRENMSNWIEASTTEGVNNEDVLRFDYGGKTFAIFRSPDDKFYATDGLCTHEKVHLCDGLVMGHIIECPKHNGRFDYTTGNAQGAPCILNLRTYAVKIEAHKVLINLE